MSIDQIARDITSEIVAEETARARLAKNGRNPANNNAGIRAGSDLHLCEMLLREIDNLRAALNEKPDFKALSVNLRLREAIQEACDLLAERKYGNTARSPGHNARLTLEAALIDG